MNAMKKYAPLALVIILMVGMLVALSVIASPARSRPLGDYSNVDGLIVEGYFGTATPQIVVKPTGGNVAFEVQNASGTPQYQVGSDGGVTANSAGSFSNLTASGTLDVTGATTLNSTLDVDGNITSGTGAITMTDAVLVTDTVTVGVDGTGADVTFYSDTAGDNLLWDTSEEALTITGTNGQDALNIDDGNVDIADDVDVDGTTNLDAVDIDGVTNLVVNIEHIGLPSIITATIPYTPASGTVATVTDGEVWFVHHVFIRTDTNFDCTGNDCTLTIGDGNAAAGFINAADANIQTTFTEATGYAAGYFGIENGSNGTYTVDDGGPFVYAPSGADETIDYAVGGTDPAAGSATAFIIYTRLQ